MAESRLRTASDTFASPPSDTDPMRKPSPAHSSSSESTATVRISSPLNPSTSSTPTKRTTPLPTVAEPSHAASEPSSYTAQHDTAFRSGYRPRGHSFSTIRQPSPASSLVAMTRVASNPIPPESHWTLSGDTLHATPRGRKASIGSSSGKSSPRSVSPLAFTWRTMSKGADTPPHGEPTKWWNARDPMPRPWQEKRQKTIPLEHTEGYIRTRQKVAEAAANVLGTMADVAHETLLLSVDVIKFAPVVGLSEAARTLLSIWDALEMVDMNRLACLSLTERCATILFSIREEISDAGNEVGEEMRGPIDRLVEAFRYVQRLLRKQNHRPFLKRYLKRDEIQGQIQTCHSMLNDALGMFSLSIQIRILKQVLRAEQQRQADTAVLVDKLLHDSPIAAGPGTSGNALMLSEHVDPPTMTVDHIAEHQVHDTLQTLAARRHEQDIAHDTADLRQLMRTALLTSSDVEMIKVLQVGRDEMPEAIKTLQRALEAEIEKESMMAEQEETVIVSAPAVPPEIAREGDERSRSCTVSSTGSSQTTSTGSGSPKSHRRVRRRDTLDREFMESGIESLRRLSRGVNVSLPPWTITRYEVDREEKIGIGFFSDVYKGRWGERVVAIKVLAPTTPRSLFVHEVSIWKTLKHSNVVELLGASSTTSDPPWFFVSPYYRNGSLVSYLKGLPSLDSVDLLKMIHEIAKGMAYLHGQGVLHGDLKGANILVDDKVHCIISDFGQSEMKSEAYRISGTPLPHGTLRWQAPELMAGQTTLTQEMDVYAFAICCIELLTKGKLPWPTADDDAVRHFVLRENMRPSLPLIRVWSLQLAEIIGSCWQLHPSNRPSFAKVDTEVQKLRLRYGADMKESPQPPRRDQLEPEGSSLRKSPDMHPIPLPILPLDMSMVSMGDQLTDEYVPLTRDTASRNDVPSLSSGASSHYISTPDSHSEYEVQLDPPGYESPPPADDRIAETRHEARYRIVLQHEFHPSLLLPLWSPSPVALGAVGYHTKPEGSFVTLFNSFKPLESSAGLAKDVPSLYGYGQVNKGEQRLDKRNAAQRGMDMIQSWLSSKSRGDGMFSQPVSRRYSSPLRTGHKTAHLFTESTIYHYVEELATPKKWFKANIDKILELYGKDHAIQKEDVYLVIGTLDAAEYAAYVSHHHPDGQVNFNVFTSPRPGKPWGQFTTTGLSSSISGGPIYDESLPGSVSASKVSNARSNGKWDTILLARLRFPTDRSEPTSL